jgi:hypothetical protein
MAVEVVTKEDLQVFRVQLLNDLKTLLMQPTSPAPSQWLKSAEVRQLLKLSAGKLQNLRLTGKLPFSRIDGILYYRAEDVARLLNNNRMEV